MENKGTISAAEAMDRFAARFDGAEFLPLYATSVKVGGGGTGHGRISGQAVSDDGALVLDLVLPKPLGGAGGPGTNPEQLFAAGYAACFHGAVALVARQMRIAATDATVEAEVTIGRDPTDGGFTLVVALIVELPGVERSIAESIVVAARGVCPYSKATRGNVETSIELR